MSPYRIARPAGFLQLNSEDSNVLSTRGSNLSSLIQSGSSTSLYNLGKQQARRPSSMYAGRKERSSEEGDLNIGYDVDGDRERRMSEAMLILQKPEMRSQRLIGNSNPRYQWYDYAQPVCN
jgi:hypothetical protein